MKISVFVPGVCCAHEWTGQRSHQFCAVCGATCSRDSDGKIVTYSGAAMKLVDAMKGGR
jgi:hypothetical protein